LKWLPRVLSVTIPSHNFRCHQISVNGAGKGISG
jgi:hypothetical protein